MPSAEQTDSPAVVHEVVEPVGAEEACCPALEAVAAGVAEGATAGMLGLSDGAAAAAAEGTTAATLSWRALADKTAESIAAGRDDEGCTGDVALDCASPEPEPPGMDQPIGVHWISWTLPSPSGAMVLNKSSGTSRSPNAQPSHESVTVAIVVVPAAGLKIEICLLQIGLLFGLAGLAIKGIERATMASPFWLVMPQDPGEILVVSTICD